MKDSITKGKKLKRGLMVGLFWLLIWQLLYILVGREIYFPAPFSVLTSLGTFVLQKAFWVSVGASIFRVLLGLALSIFIGVLFGILCSVNTLANDLMRPLIITIRSTPVISFIIIALVWFNSSNVPIFICLLMCFPIIVTNMIAGIKNVDQNLIEMAKSFKVNKFRVIRQIYVPSIKPFFTASVITSLGLGWKASVAAEVLSHPKYSIGYNIYSAKAYLESSDLFAWTFVVIGLSFFFEVLLVKLFEGSRKNANKI